MKEDVNGVNEAHADEKASRALDKPREVKRYIRAITWVVRILVGGTFVFSGFAKCIDPLGTVYKMADYIAVLPMDIPEALILPGAFTLCISEFLCGVFLLFGCFRRFSPWLLAAFMIFFTPFSLWIAIADPVPDCGCFGDALVISNWETFWKNIALCVGTIWLILFNRFTGWLIRPYLQWIAVIVSGIFSLAVSLYGYDWQPMIDFRPYPVGSHLYSEATGTEPEMVFIYEKDGEKKEFKESDILPSEDEGWTFVDRKEVAATHPEANSEKETESVIVYDEMGEEDVSRDVLGAGGKQLLLLIPDLNATTPSSSYTINSMNTWATNLGIDFAAIVAGSQEEIETWKDLSMPSYPIYTSEDTVIKEVARGNPSIVYLEDGVVMWKRTLLSLPVQDFLEKDVTQNPMDFALDSERLLISAVLIYIAAMIILTGFSFIPVLAGKISRLSAKDR